MPLIDGPRLSPAAGKACALVVFLHGYGADGNDLIEIGREWARALPDVAFASPHAPEPCAQSPIGRQWFPLTFRDPGEYRRGVVAARPLLESFLKAELGRLSLGPERLVLVGFSQGTMMALHAGLRLPGLAGILGYSGMCADPPDALKAEVTARPLVMLVHGDADQVIPSQALFVAAANLAGADIPVEWHLRPGLGHGIDARGLEMGVHYVAEVLGTR